MIPAKRATDSTFYPRTKAETFLYAPFGEITTEYNINFGNNVIPKYSFNAKELDEEIGMYYYEARYYAPPTFTSRDPLFEKYFWMTPDAYCANNPVKYVDPDGNLPILIIPIIYAAVELGLSVYDAYETSQTLTDNNASTSQKIAAGTGFVAELLLPGGGYSKVLKEGTKLSETFYKTFKANLNKIDKIFANKLEANKLAKKLMKYSKDGNIPTPQNAIEQFERIERGVYKHKETGAIYKKSHTQHKSKEGEYIIYPKGTSDFAKSNKRITTSLDGEVVGN